MSERKEEIKKASKRRKIFSRLSIALGIILAVAVALFLFLRTDFFADLVGTIVTSNLLRGTPFVLSIDRIEGSLQGDLTLYRPRIIYRGGGGVEAFELLRAEQVVFRFSMLSFLGDSRRIETLIVSEPTVHLVADSSGTFLLPKGGSDGSNSYSISRLSVHDGSLFVERGNLKLAAREINIDGNLGWGNGAVRATINRGSASESTRGALIRSLSGTVILTGSAGQDKLEKKVESRLIVDSLTVVLEQSFLKISGSLEREKGRAELSLEASPADLDELARIAGVKGKDFGSIEALVSIVGNRDSLEIEGRSTGVVRGYALDNVSFRFLKSGKIISIDSVDGFVNGAFVSGKGRYRSAARSSLVLDLETRGLDLSRGFLPKKSIPSTDLTGRIKATCLFDPLSISFELKLGQGSFRGLEFANTTVRGYYGLDTLRLEEIDVVHADHRISASGILAHGNRVSFILNADISKQSSIFSYFDIERYRADAVLNGLWEGTLDEFEVRLTGTCKNFYFRSVSLREADLRLAIEKGRRYGVYCDLEGSGFSVNSLAFDTLGLSLAYEQGTTLLKELHLARSDFSANLSAEIRKEDSNLAIKIGDCRLNAFGTRFEAAGDRKIVVSGDLVRMEDLQFHSRDGAFFADGIWNRLLRSFEGEIKLERFSLELVSRAGISSIPLGGKARGEMRISGCISDPSISLFLDVDNPTVDTLRANSLSVACIYEPGLLRIDSLSLKSASGAVSLSGRVSGFYLSEAGKGVEKLFGTALVDAQADWRGLDIAPLLSFAHVSAISAGKLDGSMSIRDSLFHPVVEFSGTVKDFSTKSFSFPALECGLKLEGAKLDLRGNLVLSERHRGDFWGRIPLAARKYFYELNRESPFAFELQVPEGDFGELMVMTPRIAESSGRYSVGLVMSGTLSHPQVSGELSIRDATLRVSGTEERLVALNASIALQDTALFVRRLVARQGKKGTISAVGFVQLAGLRPSRYDLSVKLGDFSIESFSDIAAVVSGDLAVGTALLEGKAIPEITGSCTVHRCDIFYDMDTAASSESGPTLAVPSYLAAVDLVIPGNTRIRTNEAQIEIRGQVTLYHDRQGTYFRGDIDLVRGWYSLYNNKFSIRSGKLQFIVAGSKRPVVDIEAETRDPAGKRIYLTIVWHQDDPQPKLVLSHEDAGYSETDIWMMLGGGVVGSENVAGSGWNAMGTAQSVATNYLERVLNAQMQGGVTIEIESPSAVSGESGMSDWTDTKIAVGKYLSEGLYIRYKQALSISSAREFEIEYRLSNLFLLRSQLIRYSEHTLTGKSSNTSDEINVDVKLRWEY